VADRRLDSTGTILIVGKDGQLGRHLCRAFANHNVIAVGKDTFDLTDNVAVARGVKAAAPALIINAAAYTNVDGAETDPAAAFAVNRDGVRRLAQAALEVDAALLHFSTDYVFDGANAEPYRETDDTQPTNNYGASKLAGEHAIRDSGARHLIVRTSWLFSEYPGNFVTRIRDLLHERDILNVVNDQIGSPTDAALLAKATAHIVEAATHDASVFSDANNILNIANAGSASRFALAECVAAHIRARETPAQCATLHAIPTSAYPLPARRPAYSCLALDHLRARFGVTTPDWETGIDRVLNILTAHGRA
jgi:dTDP-4-dehydrorhamnose reductase